MNTKTHFPRSRFVLNGQAQSYSKLTTGHGASMCLCAAAVAFFQCETMFWPRFLIQISSSEYLKDAFPIRYYINPGSFFFDIEYFWLNNAFIFKISFLSLFWTGSNWFLSLLYSCSMGFFSSSSLFHFIVEISLLDECTTSMTKIDMNKIPDYLIMPKLSRNAFCSGLFHASHSFSSRNIYFFRIIIRYIFLFIEIHVVLVPETCHLFFVFKWWHWSVCASRLSKWLFLDPANRAQSKF